MALNLTDLIEHADSIRFKIKRIEDMRERLIALKAELRATELLISTAEERDPLVAVAGGDEKPTTAPRTKGIPAAIEAYFRNGGAEGWLSVNNIVDILENKQITSGNLRAAVGMACTKLSRKGVLERRDVSETNTPSYEYRLSHKA